MDPGLKIIPIRIKLDLSEAKVKNQNPQFVWYPVDRLVQKTISDLKSDICEAFGARMKHTKLFLENCFLRDEDTILLLRENDIIQVKYIRERKLNSCATTVKSLKRKHSNINGSVENIDNLKTIVSQKTNMMSENHDKEELCTEIFSKCINSSGSDVKTALTESKLCVKTLESISILNSPIKLLSSANITPQEVEKSSHPENNVTSGAAVDGLKKKKRRKRSRKRKVSGIPFDVQPQYVEPLCKQSEQKMDDLVLHNHFEIRPIKFKEIEIFETNYPINNNNNTLSNIEGNKYARHIKFENAKQTGNNDASTMLAATKVNESSYSENDIKINGSFTCDSEISIINPCETLTTGNETSVICQDLVSNDVQSCKADKPCVDKYGHLDPVNPLPRVGTFIAFKMLELSELYCPEVSQYKEGKVIDVDESNDVLTIELLQVELKKHEGKFDNIYRDGVPNHEVVQKITLEWNSLIEPKLLSLPDSVSTAT